MRNYCCLLLLLLLLAVRCWSAAAGVVVIAWLLAGAALALARSLASSFAPFVAAAATACFVHWTALYKEAWLAHCLARSARWMLGWLPGWLAACRRAASS